jgi:O-succinylbenzoic acid--CoA ligase
MKFKVQGLSFSKSDLELWCWDNLAYVQPWERSHLLFILQWLSRAPFIDLRTSGTTGEPKRISLSKEMMKESARQTKELLQLPEYSKVLVCLPSQFIAGKMMIVRALVNQFELSWVKPSADPFAGISKVPDFMALTPMQVKNALQYHKGSFELLKTALIGGQAVDKSLELNLETSNVACYESYGMTETASHVALRAINGKSKSDYFQAIPLYNFESDERGCLVVKHEKWFPSGLKTNDQVELISDTSFRYLGRLDFVINSGGVKIHPEKIEDKIRPLLGDTRFMIHKEPDSSTGERVILYLEKSENKISHDPNWMKSIQDILSSIEAPKNVYVIDRFEETATSKMIRKHYDVIEQLL